MVRASCEMRERRGMGRCVVSSGTGWTGVMQATHDVDTVDGLG